MICRDSLYGMQGVYCAAIVILFTVAPGVVRSQVKQPPPLPKAAQEALNKGIIAAKVPDYLLAIRYFEEARKIAPQDPIIYLNLGLAESRVPSRELRAMAWFGAYLAAYPEAANAPAVKEQIALLEVRNQSNVSRLIKAVHDAANQVRGERRSENLERLAYLWAKAGDGPAALMVVDLIQDSKFKGSAQRFIAREQAERGDIASALKTAVPIQEAITQSSALLDIVRAQTSNGDIAGAQRTVDLIRGSKSQAQREIAEAQAKHGDVAGVAPPINPESRIAGWIKKLDDAAINNDCPLNTAPFLDLAAYLKSRDGAFDHLKSLPDAGAQTIFYSLWGMVNTMVNAQKAVVRQMQQQLKAI